MGYIIECGEGYVARSQNQSPYITTDRVKALVIDTETKANNIMSTLPKLMRSKGVQLISVNTGEVINNEYVPVDMENVKSLICNLSDQFKTMKGNKEWLADMHSKVDQEISDILHYIEFFSFNACEGYKLAKRLKELRLRRRDIKNQLEAIEIVNQHTCNMLTDGKTNKALCNIESKQYTPRVLKELFEDRKLG
jgi:hypothetical protein